MIVAGQEKKAKYWGKFKVQKVARLKKPVECHCEEIGTALFDPTIVKIEWEMMTLPRFVGQSQLESSMCFQRIAEG